MSYLCERIRFVFFFSVCPNILNCDTKQCTTLFFPKCLHCSGDKLIYKRWPEPQHTSCERKYLSSVCVCVRACVCVSYNRWVHLGRYWFRR